jgi:hypothetical protein
VEARGLAVGGFFFSPFSFERVVKRKGLPLVASTNILLERPRVGHPLPEKKYLLSNAGGTPALIDEII